AAVPCIGAIAGRTMIVAGAVAHVARCLDVAVHMDMAVHMAIVAAMMLALVMAMRASVAVVIPRFGEHRARQQRGGQGGGKKAFHRGSPRESDARPRLEYRPRNLIGA